MLDRAREQYRRGHRPPFGISKHRNLWNIVVVPSMNERRPEHPTYVPLKRRSWDENTDYRTLDRDGRRHIVSHLSGRRYHAWIDRDDSAKEVIAFSSVNHAAPAREDSSATDDDDSQSNEAEIPANTLRSGRAIRQELPVSDAASDRPLSSKENAALPQGCLNENVQRDVETRPENALKKGLTPNFLAPPTRSIGSKKGKTPDLSSLAPRVLIEKVQEPDVTILPSRSALRTESNSDLASVAGPQTGPQMAPPPAANLNLVPLIREKVFQRPPALQNRLLPLDARPRLLSGDKKRKTRMTIYVDIAGQTHARGSRSLRSCENIESFLEILCTKCNISEASIASVTVRFPWLEDQPQRGLIRLDENVGLIRTLFDEVNDAPFWQEEGTPSCNITATIVQKPGWDEDHVQAMLTILSQP